MTPAGRPENVAPVAPVVLYVILVIGAFIQTVWAFVPAAEDNVIVFTVVTFIVPLAEPAPHPPVRVNCIAKWPGSCWSTAYGYSIGCKPTCYTSRQT